jgi:hypothetical protein
MAVNLFGNSTDYPGLTVELGMASAFSSVALWDVAEWDVDVWGPDIVWTDVSAYVRSVRTNWQRSRQLDRQPSATCQLVLSNGDGRFSPANPSGDYVVGGQTQIRPRVPLRITCEWMGVTYPIFRGVTTRWHDEFPSAAADGVTTVEASDLLDVLARITLPTVEAVGAGDTVAERLARLLNAAGLNVETRFDVGDATMQATTMGAGLLSLMQLTCDSDGGLFFADPAGVLTYLDRNSPSTLYESVYGYGFFTTFTDPEIEYDDEGLSNVVRYTRVGGTEQTVMNEASVAVYGEHTLARSDLICESDDDVQDIARHRVSVASAPEQRVSSVWTQPAKAPEDWATTLALGIRYYTEFTTPVPWGTLTQQVYISGISHDIGRNGWRIQFGFEDASRYRGDGFWDSGLWGTATWWF